MALYSVGVFLWALCVFALIAFVWGLWKRSWQALAWSGAALMPPMLLIFMGGAGIWFKLCIVLPLALFAGAFYLKHKNVKAL